MLGALSFFDDDGDEAVDSSQYGNNGTYVPKGDWVEGKYGKAIKITTGSGHVDIPVTDSLNGDVFVGSFTLNGWIKPELTGDAFQHIWRSRPVESGHNTLFVNTSGFLSWRGMTPGWTTLCEGVAGDVIAREWTFFAIVSDEQKFRMYVNGNLLKEANYAKTTGNIQTYHIGGDGISENYNGAIDEICVWSKALSEAEIKGIYERGIGSTLAIDSAGRWQICGAISKLVSE